MFSLLTGAAMLALASAPAHHATTCAPLRVMTYNIRLDLESDGINRWSNRKDQFSGQIALMHPAKTPPVGPSGTWNDFQALPKTESRIDFVLVDPTINVDRYAILAWHGEEGRTASDHFPVVSDLRACKPSN